MDDVGPLSEDKKILLEINDLDMLDNEKYVSMLLDIIQNKGLPGNIKQVVELDYVIAEA
jgi:hypothetical protein